MTRWQGNIIILLLLAVLFLLFRMSYNQFHGIAVMNSKINKTLSLVEKSMAEPQNISDAAPKAASEVKAAPR